MTIKQCHNNKKQHLELLLLADEQESMLDRYLERGEMYVMRSANNEVVCLAVATLETEGTVELKNLAVNIPYQRQGYGRKMIDFLCRHYSDRCHTMLVGTGNTPSTVLFYTRCGFEYSHTVPNFFTLNYDRPIIEENILLTDMIYFRKSLI